MGTSITRATIIWFVGAAVVGAAAGALHLVRSALGGLPQSWITVATYVLIGVAALMLFHGIMVAASEQDEAARHR